MTRIKVVGTQKEFLNNYINNQREAGDVKPTLTLEVSESELVVIHKQSITALQFAYMQTFFALISALREMGKLDGVIPRKKFNVTHNLFASKKRVDVTIKLIDRSRSFRVNLIFYKSEGFGWLPNKGSYYIDAIYQDFNCHFDYVTGEVTIIIK